MKQHPEFGDSSPFRSVAKGGRSVARLAVALAAAFALHANASVVAAATPERSPVGGTSSAPFRVQIAADTAGGTPAAKAAAPAVSAPGGPSAKPAVGTRSETYYKRSQLDARPYLVTKVEPVYPPGVPPTGGKVRMRLFINEQGMVDRIAIVEATPPTKFDAAAMTAFRGAQFEPGKRKGAAVKSQIVIEMDFRPLIPPAAK